MGRFVGVREIVTGAGEHCITSFMICTPHWRTLQNELHDLYSSLENIA
jgi:hypothetical protein